MIWPVTLVPRLDKGEHCHKISSSWTSD